MALIWRSDPPEQMTNASATVVTVDGGLAQRTQVQLGLVNASAVQVKSGLMDGQVVAVGNVNGLNSGDVVLPQVRTAVASTIGAQQ